MGTVIKMPDRRELVGIAEISNVTGVTPQAVCNWRVRYPDFPKPLAELKLGPVWDYRDIARWLKGRTIDPYNRSNRKK